MQVNYIIVKNILKELRDCESHVMETEYLMNALSIPEQQSDLDRFFGHLRYLYDYGLIECVFNENNTLLGICYNAQGFDSYGSVVIRLTGKGLDFLNVLEDKKIMDKIKSYTLGLAIKFAEKLLLSSIK